MSEFIKDLLLILAELVTLGMRPQRDRAAEREALFRANRRISDEIMRRDLEGDP